jgi:amino acid adenylation domain-containing protein
MSLQSNTRCLHHLFEAQVERTPHAPALIFENRQLTYHELNRNANQVAHFLQTLGVAPEVLVGICLERSIESVTVILGIVKAGGAYLPLDPSFPIERLEYLVRDSAVSLILTSELLRSKVPAQSSTVIDLESVSAQVAAEGVDNIRSEVVVDNSICVNYTSGSTGQPKGVIKIHRGVIAPLPWASFQSDEICGLNLSLSVGVTLTRLFLPLVSGVPLVIISESKAKDVVELVETLEATGITNIFLLPPLLELLASCPQNEISRLSKLRTVATGGTDISPEVIKSFARALPQTRLFNQYGGSEIGPVTNAEVTARPHLAAVPIGRPVASAQIYLVDDKLQPVPDGAVGELYVGATHLARGYLHRPALTAERFVANPFGAIGERLYRTGDRGRYLPGGEIELLGRSDRQVKIRGFRVELGEVEAALARHQGIQDVAVTCDQAQAPHDVRLIAHLVPKVGSALNQNELRDYLRACLPEYMVPARFALLESLPRTLSGKPDYVELSSHVDLPKTIEHHAAPRASTEVRLVEIWASALGHDRVGIHDAFLELGGDSLIATRIRSQLLYILDRQVDIQSILTLTIAEIADRLERGTDRPDPQFPGLRAIT